MWNGRGNCHRDMAKCELRALWFNGHRRATTPPDTQLITLGPEHMQQEVEGSTYQSRLSAAA
jgi:hypothetical protein